MQEGFRPLIFLSKVVDITCYRQIYNLISHMSTCMEDLDVEQPPKQGDKIMIETWLIPRKVPCFPPLLKLFSIR